MRQGNEQIMKNSFWRPKWWVFLPIALPFLTYGWLQLGIYTGMVELLIPVPHEPSPSPYPVWIQTGYCIVYFILFMLTGWITILILPSSMMTKGREGVLLGAFLVVCFYCAVLYGLQLLVSWFEIKRLKSK